MNINFIMVTNVIKKCKDPISYFYINKYLNSKGQNKI